MALVQAGWSRDNTSRDTRVETEPGDFGGDFGVAAWDGAAEVVDVLEKLGSFGVVGDFGQIRYGRG